MTRLGVIDRILRRRERALQRTGLWGTPQMRSRLRRLAERAERERKRLGLPRYSPERSAMWGIDFGFVPVETTVLLMRATCACGVSASAVVMDGMSEEDASKEAHRRLDGHACRRSYSVLITGIDKPEDFTPAMRAAMRE